MKRMVQAAISFSVCHACELATKAWSRLATSQNTALERAEKQIELMMMIVVLCCNSYRSHSHCHSSVMPTNVTDLQCIQKTECSQGAEQLMTMQHRRE